ncbi:hypothetical protein DL95DRAFT_474526 [Leptodontidium sp. 2 PMI_412]|nr:hypothetical protein DL95DRAFT_474526 [Leptodontidium sp. 2 PMI_412]
MQGAGGDGHFVLFLFVSCRDATSFSVVEVDPLTFALTRFVPGGQGTARNGVTGKVQLTREGLILDRRPQDGLLQRACRSGPGESWQAAQAVREFHDIVHRQEEEEEEEEENNSVACLRPEREVRERNGTVIHVERAVGGGKVAALRIGDGAV